MIIAADRKQARVIMRYCLGLLRAVPMLERLIEGERAETVRLRNRVVIEVHTASFRTTRGYSIVAALCDEIAYWPTDEESAEPDAEVLNALRPGMATIPEAILLCASSPHARKGALWKTYAKHFAKDNDPILVWQAATRDMNATVPQSYIDAHMAEDAPRALAEYGAQFRTDVEAFVSREVVEACTSEYYEIGPVAGVSYSAFCDPAGGSGQDAFCLAIGHVEQGGERIVIDALRERRPPFLPETTIFEFSDLLKSYRIDKITGDRYSGGFVVEQFGKRGDPLRGGGAAQERSVPRLVAGVERHEHYPAEK